MHTVFHIGEINKMNNKNSLNQVDLKLTTDDDQQLRRLTKRIREEVVNGTGWQRLGQLLLELRQLDKGEELYNVLFEQTSDEGEKATYYNNLGCIKDHQGDYKKAIEYYEKALEIEEKTLPPNHSSLATSYNNIGILYDNMVEYSKAFSFYEKDLEISQKSLPSNHPLLATSYNNIGILYDNVGKYSKALLYYERAQNTFQSSLSENHPYIKTVQGKIELLKKKLRIYI
jgi:tetratricopeptide (TPR) repeat protein